METVHLQFEFYTCTNKLPQIPARELRAGVIQDPLPVPPCFESTLTQRHLCVFQIVRLSGTIRLRRHAKGCDSLLVRGVEALFRCF